MPRNTTRPRRQSNPRVLEVRVMSPRIAWLGFLRVLGFLGKVALVLALLGGLGWGAWRGVQHAFYRNPDFRLQSLDLNENPVIDELGVAAAVGIDLTAGVNLFEINIAAGEDKLRALDPFALAGVEAMAKLAASLVTALAALDAGHEDEPLALWQTACLEEEWQADLWGRDWEAEERRARREADFLRACAFARLARL